MALARDRRVARACVLFSAWQNFELLRHGYQMERLQQERAAEEEINRHLRLEIETLRVAPSGSRRSPAELHLVAPARDQAIVIERVTPPRRPTSPSSRRADQRGGHRWRTRSRQQQVQAPCPVDVNPAAGDRRALAARFEWRADDALAARLRVALLAAVLAAGRSGIEARSVYLQVIEHAEMLARADRQQLQDRWTAAKRGEILDRNGRVLAYSVDADTICADPRRGRTRTTAPRGLRGARRLRRRRAARHRKPG